MTTKSNTIKKSLIGALEKSLGVVTTACKNVGIARSTFYEWCNTDPEFKKKVDAIGDIALDFAESQLHQQIQDGNTSATIFYLKTKGKARGYIERQELAGVKDQPVAFRVNITPPESVEDGE